MGLTENIRPNDSEHAHNIIPSDNDADNVRTLMEFSLQYMCNGDESDE